MKLPAQNQCFPLSECLMMTLLAENFSQGRMSQCSLLASISNLPGRRTHVTIYTPSMVQGPCSMNYPGTFQSTAPRISQGNLSKMVILSLPGRIYWPRSETTESRKHQVGKRNQEREIPEKFSHFTWGRQTSQTKSCFRELLLTQNHLTSYHWASEFLRKMPSKLAKGVRQAC